MLAALRRAWNQAKHQVAPWWADNSKEAYSSGLDALARALDNWSESRNRRLARAIVDSGWGELRRQLAYKTVWYGSDLVVADRWYPSSKTCSACGLVRAKLALAERTFTCEGCGLVLDRDANAARNLASLVARSGRETVNARGGM